MQNLLQHQDVHNPSLERSAPRHLNCLLSHRSHVIGFYLLKGSCIQAIDIDVTEEIRSSIGVIDQENVSTVVAFFITGVDERSVWMSPNPARMNRHHLSQKHRLMLRQIPDINSWRG